MIFKIILLALYLIVPIIVYYQVIKMKYHFHVFALAALYAVFVAWHSGFSLHDLGFRIDNFVAVDGYYYIMFFLAFGLSAYFKQNRYTFGYKRLLGNNINSFKGLWFVPVQEIIFRGVLFPLLLSFSLHKLVIIPIMAFLFGFAHIPFHSSKIFWLTLFLGFGLSGIYVFMPNIYLVSITHAIIWIAAQHFKVI
ncbi:MAG: CPBP family glutamic-type intramembrane protease [archaeon]